MKNRKEYESIENELFNYFEELKMNQEIPISTQNAINNVFKEKRRNKITYRIPQIVIYLFSIIIISTGVVFANEILTFVKSLFINTTNSIDMAVQNGYVQQVDMDYIFSNDIGIKIDNLILDDSNLDISFVYKCDDNTIDGVELYEYEIRDQNNSLIYKLGENKNELTEGLHLIKYNDSVKIDMYEHKESLLISSNEFSEYEKIIIQISAIRIKKNNEFYIQSGNWNFEQNIDTNILKSKKIKYYIESNNDLKSYDINMTETSLKFELVLNESIKNDLLKEKDSINLIDKVNQKYDYNVLKLKDNILYLEYDIGLYNENVDELTLILKYNQNREDKLILKKGIVK